MNTKNESGLFCVILPPCTNPSFAAALPSPKMVVDLSVSIRWLALYLFAMGRSLPKDFMKPSELLMLSVSYWKSMIKNLEHQMCSL